MKIHTFILSSPFKVALPCEKYIVMGVEIHHPDSPRGVLSMTSFQLSPPAGIASATEALLKAMPPVGPISQ
jgi:hypothetical protein